MNRKPKGTRRQARQKETRQLINRKDFLQYTAGTAAALGLSRLLPGCGDSDGGNGGPGFQTEPRTLYFNLSHADPSLVYHFVVAGRAHPLSLMTPERLAMARGVHPLLGLVPDDQITHFLEAAELPADRVCLCHVTGQAPGVRDGTWTMPLMFTHIPPRALEYAEDLASRSAEGAERPVSHKWAAYGIDPAVVRSLDPKIVLAAEANFKDSTDQARTLVSQHPEVLTGDPNATAYVQHNVMNKVSGISPLAHSISTQGTASETGGWATMVVYYQDPDTKQQPYYNSKGQKQCDLSWSNATASSASGCYDPTLKLVKNDRNLGQNVTDGGPPEEGAEKPLATLWGVQDGITTGQADGGQGGASGAYTLTLKDLSTHHGFKIKKVDSKPDDPARVITIDYRNWYVRYLSLYVRFLDANQQPIPVKNLPADVIKYFDPDTREYDGENDCYAELVHPQIQVLGIPIDAAHGKFQFEVPEQAASVLLLAGGLGMGKSEYPDTLDVGLGMTLVANFSIPTIFLAGCAALAYGGFANETIPKGATLTWALFQVGLKALVGVGEKDYLDDPNGFKKLAFQVGQILLGGGAMWGITKAVKTVLERINFWIGTDAAIDQVPFLGGIMQAIASAGLAAQLVQTTAEVFASPKTYVNEIVFTHDLTVTILHDPNDATFPEVATHYVLTAIFDGGTPYTSGRVEMPTENGHYIRWSDPLVYDKFRAMPYGGNVSISVAFYSDDGWLSGKGSTGVQPNTQSALGITIEEVKVPLTQSTVYRYKERISLDANGHHVWDSTKPAPTATAGDLVCAPSAGLCQLVGVTVSETAAAIGYSWQSFTAGEGDPGSGSSGQLHQYANLSLLQQPEQGYLRSPGGFTQPVRLAYDLMGRKDHNFYVDPTGGSNIVRRVTLEAGKPPVFDPPSSNRAFGRLTHPTSSLLIHPAGKLVSVSNSVDKVEVLDLPVEALPDAEAPLALAHSATGTREGLLSGPVAAALSPSGELLVLEGMNRRIQAFDIGVNPVRRFKDGAYFTSLTGESEGQPVKYLDVAVEYTGYIYVLSYVSDSVTYQYRLDVYTPEGEFLSRSVGVNVGRLAVDFWRNVYALCYESVQKAGGGAPSVTEPSVTLWVPSTP